MVISGKGADSMYPVRQMLSALRLTSSTHLYHCAPGLIFSESQKIPLFSSMNIRLAVPGNYQCFGMFSRGLVVFKAWSPA
jgi:hypothetical protein